MTVVYVIYCLSVCLFVCLSATNTCFIAFHNCFKLFAVRPVDPDYDSTGRSLHLQISIRRANLSRTSEFTPSYLGVSIAQAFVFCIMICRSLIVLFLLTIVLSVCLFCDLWFFPVRALVVGYGKNFHNFNACCL